MKTASRIFLATVLSVAPCLVPTHAVAAEVSKSVTITGDQTWIDTGMDVNAGDKLHITATGTVTMGNNSGITPAGAQRGWVDTLRPLMVPSAGRGALVGRVGNSDAATPFLVGADGTVLVPFS